jgi:hypothetical protein
MACTQGLIIPWQLEKREATYYQFPEMAPGALSIQHGGYWFNLFILFQLLDQL